MAGISYRDFIRAFKALGLGPYTPVLVHASLEGLGEVQGGARTVVAALLSSFETLLFPAFTPQCMVVPPEGSEDNGLDHTKEQVTNSEAEFFHAGLASGLESSEVLEEFRAQPGVDRSTHPLLSFCGRNCQEALAGQSLQDPLAPIGWMAEFDGDILLLGVDHRQNTSLHYAERLAGRKQFLRWALTTTGILQCPGMPGCSDGFQDATPLLKGLARRVQLESSVVETVPERDMLHRVTAAIRQDPRLLLCDQLGCLRCAAVRASIRNDPEGSREEAGSAE